jgi:hypothetical protein
MLLFRDSDDNYAEMTPPQKEELMAEWKTWYDDLVKRGKVQHAHPLVGTGRLVSGARGERIVDGPFAEAKETIGGYFFLNVEDLEEATTIAQGSPNLKHGMVIEVRPVSTLCPIAKSIGWETMQG